MPILSRRLRRHPRVDPLQRTTHELGSLVVGQSVGDAERCDDLLAGEQFGGPRPVGTPHAANVTRSVPEAPPAARSCQTFSRNDSSRASVEPNAIGASARARSRSKRNFSPSSDRIRRSSGFIGARCGSIRLPRPLLLWRTDDPSGGAIDRSCGFRSDGRGQATSGPEVQRDGVHLTPTSEGQGTRHTKWAPA